MANVELDTLIASPTGILAHDASIPGRSTPAVIKALLAIATGDVSGLGSIATHAASEYQLVSALLTALAGLAPTVADRLPYFNGVNTVAVTTLSTFIRTLLDDADAATARGTLGLVIGTNVQGFDADLAAFSGLTGAADQNPYFTGVGAMALHTITAFARTLLDDVDAATMRATLGILSMALQASNAVAITGGTAQGVQSNKDNALSGAKTLSVANFAAGRTLTNSGAAAVYTVPSRIVAASTAYTETLMVRNRGSGAITFTPSGVTVKGQTSCAIDKSASLEWEHDGTTEWCWIDATV